MSPPATQPHPGAALWKTAHEQFGRAQWQAAQASYQALLALMPGHPPTLLQLSYVESYLGNYRSARNFAMQALATGIKSPELLSVLVARLRTFNEGAAVNTAIGRLPPLSQVAIPHLLVFAAQLSYLNEQEQALTFLDEAMRGDPDYPPTLLARGQILTYLGRFDEAEADLERCILHAPQLAQAHWFVSRLRKQTAASNHVERLRGKLGQPASGPEDKALLQYALHKELDDIGDLHGAWQALELACRAKRALLQYRADDSRELIDKLVGLPLPVTAEPVADAAAVDPRTPIFIVGMHRSGTTLLEQLLDGHSEVRGVGELYDFTSQMRSATNHHCRAVIDTTIVERAAAVDFMSVGAGYVDKMRWRLGGERFFTDKLPSNFLNLGFICRALPQAKILHMVRDPMETCFSNLRELFTEANPYSYDQLELADYYKQYRRLMAHWHGAYPGRILDVDYAALTRDPEGVLREVAAFCGLEFQPSMLLLQQRTRGVATASAVQVRDKVVVREQPKWAPYADHLQPLIEALRD